MKTLLSFRLVVLIFTFFVTTIFATTSLAHDHGKKKADNPDSNIAAANIVETASSAGQFQTLLAAAEAAGLVSALAGDGPLTVFAPTDDAFGALPVGTINELLKEENKDKLARILSYHVVSGQIGSDALADEVSLKSLAGPRVNFVQTENGFSVEGARIVSTDISASNGVIHVIDRVILPPEQMSRRDAEQIIMSAISEGVPLFNHGNPEATATLYENAITTLMDSADLTKKEIKRLQEGLLSSKESNTFHSKAWMLRYALDEVMASLRSTSGMRT